MKSKEAVLKLIRSLPEDQSIVALLASMPQAQRSSFLQKFPPELLGELTNSWFFTARPSQVEPEGDWRLWLYLAGRASGKTRTAAEFVRDRVQSGRANFIGLVARTAADYANVQVKGESGIIACYNNQDPPIWVPSQRKLKFSNGAEATCYSSEKPDALRGPQHDLVWMDEFASFKYIDEVVYNFEMGLRLGKNPQAIVTTTPRPLQQLRAWVDDPRVAVTKGHTFANRANLPTSYLSRMKEQFEGTTLGRQELAGELLAQSKGALWQRAWLDEYRVSSAPMLTKLVLTVDPSIKKTGDEAGIIVAGSRRDEAGRTHGYVIEDASMRGSPDQWARRAINKAHEYGIPCITAEANQGGEMIRTIIEGIDPNMFVKLVNAQLNKQARAEPVAAKYEQGRVHHVGTFGRLEDQLCNWVPLDDKTSPDRLDALVWAMHILLMEDRPIFDIEPSFPGARPSPWVIT